MNTKNKICVYINNNNECIINTHPESSQSNVTFNETVAKKLV